MVLKQGEINVFRDIISKYTPSYMDKQNFELICGVPAQTDMPYYYAVVYRIDDTWEQIVRSDFSFGELIEELKDILIKDLSYL